MEVRHTHRPLRVDRLTMIRPRRSQLIAIYLIIVRISCAVSHFCVRSCSPNNKHTRSWVRPSPISPDRLRIVHVLKVKIHPILGILLLPSHEGILDLSRLLRDGIGGGIAEQIRRASQWRIRRLGRRGSIGTGDNKKESLQNVDRLHCDSA